MAYIKKCVSSHISSDIKVKLRKFRDALDRPTAHNISCWIGWDLQMYLSSPIDNVGYLQGQMVVNDAIRAFIESSYVR